MSRWVVVDDVTGTGISYGGVWQVSDGMLDDMPVDGGPPLYNTLHGARSHTSISYTFKGSSFVVVGSQFPSAPLWTCSIDGEPVTLSNASSGDNQHLCAGTVNDGTHNIVMEISATEDEPFWFDYFQILPSADMGLDQADVVYGTDDSLVDCDSDWDPMQIGTMTMKNGSMMSFDFNGVSLSWFGVYNSSHHRGPASATYSVDGETPIPFLLENVSSDDTPLLSNQPFFQTSKYSAGQHRLEVVYHGQPETTPLTLQHLIVQNSSPSTPTTLTAVNTVTTVATATVWTTTSTSIPSHSSSGTNARMIGSIVGGAIGGFLFLALLAMAFLLLRRCSSRRTKEGHPEAAFRDVIEPYTHNPLLRLSGYNPLPSSTTKRPLLLGNNQITQTSRTATRRSIIQSLMGRFTGATFGSAESHSEASTLLPSHSSRHTRTRTSGSWIVVHEDSGIRMLPELPQINTDVIEIPPTYSVE